MSSGRQWLIRMAVWVTFMMMEWTWSLSMMKSAPAGMASRFFLIHWSQINKTTIWNIPESVPIPGIWSGNDRKCLQKSRQEVLHFPKDFRKRRACGLITAGAAVWTEFHGCLRYAGIEISAKEFRISDEDGNNYFLDYLIDTADGRVAIEENGIHYHHPQLIGIEGYRKQLRKQNTCALWGLKLYRFSTEDCRFKDRIEDDIRSYLGKIPADSGKRDWCWNVKRNCMSTRRSALRR